MAVEVNELYVSDTIQIANDDDIRVRVYHLRSDQPSADNCRSASEIAEFLKGGGTFSGWRLWYGSDFTDDPSGAARGATGRATSAPEGTTDLSRLRCHHVDVERIGGNQFTLCDYRLTFKFSRKRTAWQPKVRWSTQEKTKRLFRDLNAEECPCGSDVVAQEPPQFPEGPCDPGYTCQHPLPTPDDCLSWFSYSHCDETGVQPPAGLDYLGQNGQGINVVDQGIMWEFSRFATIYELRAVHMIEDLIGTLNAEPINIIAAGDVTTNIPVARGRWKFEDFEGDQMGDVVFRVTARFLSDRDYHYEKEYLLKPGTNKILRPPQCHAKRTIPLKCYNWVLSSLMGLTLA